MDGQTWRRIIRTETVVFENLSSWLFFQSSFLLFATYDILLGRHICLTRSRVPKGFRAPGLRTQNSGAPRLRTKINRAPGLPRNWSRAASWQCFFALIQKQILELRKYSNFYFFKRCFYTFFPVFHSYLEFTNRDQWIRLIFDTVNDVSGFEG